MMMNFQWPRTKEESVKPVLPQFYFVHQQGYWSKNEKSWLFVAPCLLPTEVPIPLWALLVFVDDEDRTHLE